MSQDKRIKMNPVQFLEFRREQREALQFMIRKDFETGRKKQEEPLKQKRKRAKS